MKRAWNQQGANADKGWAWKALRAAARRAQGFTLMEVLVAVVIIGLGALGISALFAGAAAQQRRATVVNRAVGVSQNAESILLTRFGRMEGSSPSVEGVWSQAVADPQTGVLTTADRAYFLVDAGTRVLFEQTFQESQLNGPLPSTTFFALPHRRIDRERLRVMVTVTESSNLALNPKEETFVYLEQRINGQLPTGELDPVLLYRDGDITNPDVVTVNRAENTGFAGATGSVQTPNLSAVLTEFLTRQGVSGFVSSVAITYEWRNDQLVSLNDRLVYVDDERMPGGRRPILGYTLLSRQIQGVAQLAIFTYELEPLSAPRVDVERFPIFQPPERVQDYSSEQGLLRQVRMRLGWDANTGQFYVEPTDPDEAWAIDRGQLLLVKELLTPVGGVNWGADGAVRVVGQRRVRTGSDTVTQGVLSDSPRILGRSPLRSLNQTVNVLVWAMPPIAKNISDPNDDTEWSVRPVEVRVVQALAP